MTDPQPSAANPTPPPDVAAADRMAANGRAERRRALAQFVAEAAARIGNWLASIGWGKFILLSLLMLMLAALADDIFFSARKTHKHDTHLPVEVKISVDSDGLRISRPSQDQPAAAQPKVRIDENGVRIEADRHGRKVVIDRHGVSVEEAAPKAGAEGPKSPAASGSDKAAEGSGSAKVTVPPGVINDPEKVAEAVEAAKEQIEQIVQEQVDRKVERLKTDRPDEPSRWPDVADWVLMLVFAMLIMKIALGSKRRAESRAEAADAAAAEEGLKRQLAEAQLKTMQAQVEPHFLFNTLASVDYLIETDPARASRMQKNLIQYLRAALPQMRQASSTLGQEMAQCRSYLEILKVRMDDRLQFAITMPAGLSTAAFPPMMLQTLVENSIKHGLEPKPEGGVLTLSADVVNGNLRVVVSDTGLGFGAAGSGGGGVGLNNVRERLQALFGARGRLTIEANSPSGTIATIQVPYTVGVAEPAPQSSPQPA